MRPLGPLVSALSTLPDECLATALEMALELATDKYPRFIDLLKALAPRLDAKLARRL